MKRELDCKEVARLLSDDHEQPMPPTLRARLRLHLVVCTACRNVDAQFRFLREAMRMMDKSKPRD